MCNPDVPNEFYVMDLDGMHTAHRFVIGKAQGTEVTVLMSFHALQRVFAYAIKTGIVTTDKPVYYRDRGKIRRYKDGETAQEGVETDLGTGYE